MRRAAALGVIVVVWMAVVLHGRYQGPIPLRVAVLAATNGSFYHWREMDGAGALVGEGWCAYRRSRTLAYRHGKVVREERRSPSGIYQSRVGFRLNPALVGMEAGNDFLSHETARVSGAEAVLQPLGEERYAGGRATYTLERGARRIVGIDFPGVRIVVDYPLALDSGLFEPPERKP